MLIRLGEWKGRKSKWSNKKQLCKSINQTLRQAQEPQRFRQLGYVVWDMGFGMCIFNDFTNNNQTLVIKDSSQGAGATHAPG